MEFLQKITVIKNHISNEDLNLAFKKLIDCTLDINNFDFYKEIIQIANELESNKLDLEQFKSKLIEFVSKIEHLSIERPQIEDVLQVINLTKSYGKRNFQVKNINFTIKHGDIIGLVGENGNGKTTLLRTLANELEFDQGEINYSFYKGKSKNNLNSEICYIPQRTPKWQGTLKSNLKFAASHYGVFGEENELLTNIYIIRFGLWKFRNHKWNELSSGYKMRFELARTFLRAPKLLLLDEPLANLDVLAQQQVLDDLKNLAANISKPIAIILSSQQLFEVEKIATQVIFLKNGKPTYREDLIELNQKSVIELDINCSKDELLNLFKSIGISEILNEGGNYILNFNSKVDFSKILSILSTSSFKTIYVRDITESTRKLFINQSV